MKVKGVFLCLVSFFLFSFLTGCKTLTEDIKVRTYTVEEQRVDQNLSDGNRGYLVGRPQCIDKDENRKLTRTKYVAEIELGSAGRKDAASAEKDVELEVAQEPDDAFLIEEVTVDEVDEEPAPIVKKMQSTKYTVEKNDTLQKISMKFYGTTKKWKKIYDANADKLKTPDRIYRGQVLNIPQD